MNRNGRTFIEVLGAAAIFGVLGFAVYHAGASVVKESGVITAKLGFTYTQWLPHYEALVYAVTSMTAGGFFSWYFLARFAMRVSTPPSSGKRLIWLIIGAAEILLCFLVPFAYKFMDTYINKALPISVPLIFFFAFAGIGYWGASLFLTPAPYKYTPLFADKIKMPKGGK